MSSCCYHMIITLESCDVRVGFFVGLSSPVAGGTKRPLEIDGISEDAKRPRLDLSAGQTLPQIPSILSSSKSFPPVNHISPAATVPFPLINPVAVLSNGQPSKPALETPQLKVAPLQMPLSPPVSGASSSVALLVQLYKHYQSTNDTQGLQRVRAQLLALHKHLSTKPAGLPSSPSGSLQGSLPATSVSGTLPGTSLTGQLSSLPSLLNSLPGQLASSLVPTQLNSTVSNQLNFQPATSSTLLTQSSGISPAVPQTGGGPATATIVSSGFGTSSGTLGASVGTGPLVGGASAPVSTGLLLPRPGTIPLATPINNTQHHSLLGKPLVPPITIASSSSLKSPSIVTHSFPSSNATMATLPLGPLQVSNKPPFHKHYIRHFLFIHFFRLLPRHRLMS